MSSVMRLFRLFGLRNRGPWSSAKKWSPFCYSVFKILPLPSAEREMEALLYLRWGQPARKNKCRDSCSLSISRREALLGNLGCCSSSRRCTCYTSIIVLFRDSLLLIYPSPPVVSDVCVTVCVCASQRERERERESEREVCVCVRESITVGLWNTLQEIFLGKFHVDHRVLLISSKFLSTSQFYPRNGSYSSQLFECPSCRTRKLNRIIGSLIIRTTSINCRNT